MNLQLMSAKVLALVLGIKTASEDTKPKPEIFYIKKREFEQPVILDESGLYSNRPVKSKSAAQRRKLRGW